MRRVVASSAAAAAALIAAAAGPSLAAHAAGPTHRPAGTKPTTMAYGSIVVGAGAHVFVFAPGAHGNVAPIRTIAGAATGLANAGSVDLDSAGNIWTADVTNSAISKFSPVANGNVAPRSSFYENNNDDELPLGIAVTNDDKHVWIGNDGSSILASYATTASGATTATRRIDGSNTGISYSHDVALSPDGRHLFQSDGGTATINEFSTRGVENQAPIRSIVLGDHTVHFNEGVAVDRAGNVWVSDDKTDALYEFGASNTVPIRTITGSQTGLVAPEGMSFDAKGNLWVATGGDQGSNIPSAIEAFSPEADGDATPLVRIAGSATTLPFANDVAVYAAKPGPPRAVVATAHRHAINVRWAAPTRTGGGVVGYVVERKKGRAAKWHVVATSPKRSYADHRVTSGHRYRYAVIADNEIGASGLSKVTAAKAR